MVELEFEPGCLTPEHKCLTHLTAMPPQKNTAKGIEGSWVGKYYERPFKSSPDHWVLRMCLIGKDALLMFNIDTAFDNATDRQWKGCSKDEQART